MSSISIRLVPSDVIQIPGIAIAAFLKKSIARTFGKEPEGGDRWITFNLIWAVECRWQAALRIMLSALSADIIAYLGSLASDAAAAPAKTAALFPFAGWGG